MSETREFLGFSRSMLLQCLLLLACILAGLFIHIGFLVVAAAITLLTALICPVQYTFYQLMFTLPFTVIYKLSPESISLFIYVMLAVSIILLFRTRFLQGNSFVLILLLSVYLLSRMGNNYADTIKIISGMFLLLIFVKTIQQADFKNQIFAFVLGMLGSSIMGIFKPEWLRIRTYFADSNAIYINGERTFRFSGLYYDPNYYSISAIFVIFFCLYLFFNKDVNRILLGALVLTFSIFGCLSYSKMFLIALVFVAIIFIFRQMKSLRSGIFAILAIGVISILFFTLSDNFYYWITMQERFSAGEDISTGRFEIWGNYLTYIFNSPKVLLVGDGLSAEPYQGYGAHNTPIEFLYYIGLVGLLIYVATVLGIIKSNRFTLERTRLDYGLWIVFAIMISSLGMLMMNDFIFYFMMLWMSTNMQNHSEENMSRI